MIRGRLVRLARNIERSRWDYPYSIWTMTGGTFINTFGGSMVFPIFSLYFTAKFGLTLAEAGLLSTTFVIGSIVGQPLGGFLTDRLGRKGIMVFALVAEATFSMGMALAPNVPVLVIDVLLFGLTVPMFNMVIIPASQTLAADLAPIDMRGRYQAMYGLTASLGFGIGPVVAGYLFDVGRGQWIWIGSLIIGLMVAMGYRAFGPMLNRRQAAAA
ncbi:MAG: MFS transporter [Anaerolineae bacterium]